MTTITLELTADQVASLREQMSKPAKVKRSKKDKKRSEEAVRALAEDLAGGW